MTAHRSPRRLGRSVPLVALVVTSAFVWPPVAAADEDAPGGDVVTGELVRAWPEYAAADEAAEHGQEGPLTWIQPDEGDAVRVPTQDVEDLELGATVEVALGNEVVDPAVEEGIEPAREVLGAEVLAPAEPDPTTGGPVATTVTNEVTVVMMVPSHGVRETGRTIDQVVAAVQTSVHDFWSAETNGAVAIGVSAEFDWFQGTVDCSDPYALWDEAATHAGWVEGPGRHLLVYLPRGTPGCAYGLAEIGAAPTAGGRMYATDVAVSLIAHEFGHNFGLGHSGGLQCDRSTQSGDCSADAYRDLYDVMGYAWGPVGSLHAAHAASLGALPSAQQAVVSATTAGRAYTLAPLSGRSGVRAIRLTDTRGQVYWLEFRTPSGRDSWLGTTDNAPGLQHGVLLRQSLGRNDTALLDGSPSAPTGWSQDYRNALRVGVPATVSGGEFRITVQSVTAGAATVWIGTAGGMAGGGNAARPVGSLDGVSVDPWGTSISARGWALDRDTPTDVVNVHLYVGGRGLAIPAAGGRPDVGRVFPGAGDAHGFGRSVPVTPGTHDVCAFAIDSAGVGHTALGCRTVTVVPRMPVGSLDVVTATGATLTVRGWALDRDEPLEPLSVHLYVDGRGTSLRADGDRGDIGRVFPPAGRAHGFTHSAVLSAGRHTVCAYAIDSSGGGSTLLGCRTVTVVPSLPIGSLDSVSVSGSTITVRGWTFDRDTPTVALRAHVYIGRSGTSVSADGDRADVATVFPAAGPAHGFTMSSTVPPGEHRVCVYGIDSTGAGSALLGCRTVTA